MAGLVVLVIVGFICIYESFLSGIVIDRLYIGALIGITAMGLISAMVVEVFASTSDEVVKQ